jgi:hypothetical protein
MFRNEENIMDDYKLGALIADKLVLSVQIIY